ncbi:hypothetical protein [Reichenbachiella versicolor]|uniref:hypothetical protein n=1 Tax=Reichenbachiella versicolor TaxID=1821036 RepID=UPI000D6DC72D|nr:hypothetical protein [Reichenbachiella versicolor]
MNWLLLLSGILSILLVTAHSIIGELKIFRSSKNSPQGMYKGILWASWHALTLFGYVCGSLLIFMACNTFVIATRYGAFSLYAILATYLISALLIFSATKGKHPAWGVLLIISVLLTSVVY